MISVRQILITLLLILPTASPLAFANISRDLEKQIAANEKLMVDTLLFYFPEGEMPDDHLDQVIATIWLMERLDNFVLTNLKNKNIRTQGDWELVRHMWMQILSKLTSDTLKDIIANADKLRSLGLPDHLHDSPTPFSKRDLMVSLATECKSQLN